MKLKTLLGALLTFTALSLPAQTALDIALLANQTAQLSWPASAVGATLESSAALGTAANWQPVAGTPTLVNGRYTVQITAGVSSRFFRLRLPTVALTTVRESSPSAGETGVAVTRETIFRLSAPLAASTVIGPDTLFAGFGGRRLLSRAQLSSDRRTLTLFYLENLPASARVNVVLDATGLVDENGKLLDADGDGQPGGVRVHVFETLGITALPGTAVIGHVFASEKNPDGSNKPLVGVTITVDGAEETLRAVTLADGSFSLDPAPGGRFFVHIDGRTAVGSRWPSGAYYPFVGKAWDAFAGRTDNLAGGSGEVFLPLIQSDALQPVNATAETKITFAPSLLATNPALAGVEINVPANSLFADNGTRGGKVGIAPVPADRLPGPLPPGLNFPLVITIQTDGAANFDVPVPVKFPNLPDPKTGVKLGPGAQTALWSFNHDTGQWEIQGSATVTADGNFVVSAPGVGVRQPGWHGVAPGTRGSGPKPKRGGNGPDSDPDPRKKPECDDPCAVLAANYVACWDSYYQRFLKAIAPTDPQELKNFNEAKAEKYAECDDKLKDLMECRGDGPNAVGPCNGPGTSSAVPSPRSDLAKQGAGADTVLRTAVALTQLEQTFVEPGVSRPGAGDWYRLASLQTGFAQNGRLNEQGDFENIILAPDEFYFVTYYSPSRKRLGGAIFRSAINSTTVIVQTTIIPGAIMQPDTITAASDTDGDGVSDVAEHVLGTADNLADSDGDGIKDGQEVFTGSNPLDGVGLPKGVIGVGATPGPAIDVAAGNNLAVLIADGLVVFDVSKPESPVQTAVLSGQAKAVALRGSTALVAFDKNLRLVDLASPSTPVTLWSRDDVAAATAVEFGRASAFVVKGATLHRLDLTTGITTGTLNLPMQGESILARGDLIYILGPESLAVCRDDDLLNLVTTVASLAFESFGFRNRLTSDGEFLYVTRLTGVDVFDLSDPAAPFLLRSHSPGQFGWRLLAPTSAGLALAAVGPNNAPDGTRHVSLFNVNPGGTNLQFIATFATPGSSEAVAIAGARAFVADHSAGLAVVNYLDPDLAGIPPTVVLDLDSVSVPPQVEGDSVVRLGARANDDVGVHHVDFIINGKLQARDDSYPFEMFYRTPPVTASTKSFTLRLRAEDTAGNFTETPEITIGIVPDATPPKLVALDPASAGVIPPNIVTEIRAEFLEPVATPVSTASLVVVESGPDGKLGTTDDVVFPGAVQYDAASKTVVFTANAPLPVGQYRATLAAGLADAAGNGRPRPVVWDFKTGPEPRVVKLFPPSNYVQVGGSLKELRFTFDQRLPKAAAATYAFTVERRAEDGAFVAVSPLHVQLDTDAQTFVLQTSSPFPPGDYRVTGSGPNVQPMFWEFNFRDVPNEWILNENGQGVWKYFPGPVPGDSLIINAPGTVAQIDVGDLVSVLAHSDVRWSRQTLNVQNPIESFGELALGDITFGEGVTHARGPLRLFQTFVDGTDIGPHTLNAYAGGVITSSLKFSDPNGALVNQPQSLLVISNGTYVPDPGTRATNAGRFVNLGTVRSANPEPGTDGMFRFEGVRLQNNGRWEITQGGIVTVDLQNEGVIDIAAGAKLLLLDHARGGFSSRITGAGAVEFGANNYFGQRGTRSLTAEFRGDLDVTGPFTVIAGNVTLWRPLVRLNQGLDIQAFGTLRLLAPSQLDAVKLTSGMISFNTDSQIKTLDAEVSSTMEAATLARVTGDARLRSITFQGLGVVEFAGQTVASNGNQTVGIAINGGTLRNSGTFLLSDNSNAGSIFDSRALNNQPATGAFENGGLFQQTTTRPLAFLLPFRNAGRVELKPGTVVFDGQPTGFGDQRRGAYLPQPGCELVMSNTTLQYLQAGTLDLTAGTLRGTGKITASSNNGVARVINRAILRVGDPMGALSVAASDGFEQTASGELIVTLGSNGNSRLDITSGTTRLDGTLRVELEPGFDPAVGQSFSIITYRNHTGQFSNALLPGLVPGKKLDVASDSAGVKLRVVVP